MFSCLLLAYRIKLIFVYLRFFKKKIFIYLFIRDTEREREAETQAEGGAGSMQGAQGGTQSPVSRITPWAEGGAKLLSHPAALETTFKIILGRVSGHSK